MSYGFSIVLNCSLRTSFNAFSFCVFWLWISDALVAYTVIPLIIISAAIATQHILLNFICKTSAYLSEYHRYFSFSTEDFMSTIPYFSRFLLVPQCLDRIQFRCLIGRIISEEYTDKDGEADRQRNACNRRADCISHHIGSHCRNGHSKDDSNDTAHDTQYDCFHDKL